MVAIFKSPAARLREAFPITKHNPISVPESSTSRLWKLAMKLRNIKYKRIDLPNKVVHIVHATFIELRLFFRRKQGKYPIMWETPIAAGLRVNPGPTETGQN